MIPSRSFAALLALLVTLASTSGRGQGLAPARGLEPFPQFLVPGQDAAMSALNRMHRLHYPPVWLDYPHKDPQAGLCTLWDEWLTGPCLWADLGSFLVCDGKVSITQRLRNSFLNKIIDVEGYVATHQHEGIGHVLGWPFPYWINNPGAWGVHFSARGTVSAVLTKGAPVTVQPEGWTLAGVEARGTDPEGWRLRLTAPDASLTTAPISFEAFQAPFIQIRWSAKNLGSAQPFLEWDTPEQPGFTAERRMVLPAAALQEGEAGCVMVPLHRHPAWRGRISRLRLRFANDTPGAEVLLQAIFTQYDTRHNINNFDFIRGCIDFFLWTGDVDFLRQALPRIRLALRYAQAEFKTRENLCVLTSWVGHDGRSGIERAADGSAVMKPGVGIGNNYWDLLPFGHKDSYATIRYYDTLVRLAALERDIDRHPEWALPAGEGRFNPDDLERHAAAVKAEGNRLFWSEETGRFVAGPDIDGRRTDYGFTFLNTDAIHYGFATDAHARRIMDWIGGRRIVEGDTSTGADIYHFRFGPRSTTRRNTDYYFWRWSKAASIPFGGQVQDGGAVLGWSYMDLMARLRVDGPDNAWQRLSEITRWFDDVQAGGGYREYYRKLGAQLQGDGAAGGLGLDREFFESLLVPQVMLRGFLGFSPIAKGCRIEPRLPSSFPSLTIEGIRIQGLTLSVTASADTLVVRKRSGTTYSPFVIEAPGYRPIPPVDWSTTNEITLTR
ncbi:MAG: hypothetical protein JNJ82_12425 [Opitutaceae bacterium]|nr:hypothetical protein [Opitutaceae bacterium]